MTRRWIALMVWLVLGAACRGLPAPAASAPAFPLPDVSKAAPSVQRQIRDQHAALERVISASPSPDERAAVFGELGKLLMAAQFTDAAARSFESAMEADDRDYRWPYYLAHLARTRGDTDAALVYFQQASRLKPDDVAARVWLGETYLQAGQADAAEPEFARARELDPASVSAVFGLGRTALARRDYRRAIALLEEVLARDPRAVSAHYPLSQAYAGAGDTRQAETHLRLRADHQVLPADPLIVELETLLDSPQTYEALGIRALDRHDLGSAAEQFRRGLALDPQSAALHHRLGTVLALRGDRGAARREFETAAGLSKDYYLAPFSLGLLLQEDGQHAAAAAQFDAALQARPDYVPARLRRASNLRRAGRDREAVAEYRRLLEANRDLSEARIGLATTLSALGQGRAARAVIEAGVTGPDAQMFRHALARLLAASPDPAVRDGQQSLRMVHVLEKENRSLDLGETLAMALAEVGDFAGAAAVQRDLIAAADQMNQPAVKARLAANLARYARREPSRVPWTLDEVP